MQISFYVMKLIKKTSTENRATTLSISSFHANLWKIITLPLIGFTIDHYGIQKSYLIFTIVLVILFTLIKIINKK